MWFACSRESFLPDRVASHDFDISVFSSADEALVFSLFFHMNACVKSVTFFQPQIPTLFIVCRLPNMPCGRRVLCLQRFG